MLPTISNYGQYRSGNYGAHCLKVSMSGLDVYFSYGTPVAFRHSSTSLVVRQNDWGPTTGRHLNWIDVDKRNRIDGNDFERQLTEIIDKTEG